MNRLLLFVTLLGCLLLASCTEVNSNDAMESYQMWSDNKPANGVRVLRGKYWKSAHFTDEHIIYLELRGSAAWDSTFIRQNNLILKNNVAALPEHPPYWFSPSADAKIWGGADGQSRYYLEAQTHHWFVYQVQL